MNEVAEVREEVVGESQDTLDDVSLLSDEELSARLKGDTTEPETKEEEIKPDETKPAEKTTKKKKPKEDTPQEEETVSISKAELEKMQQRIADEQLMIARQGTEVGQLRKAKEALVQRIAQLEQSLTFDNLAENTGQTLERAAELNRTRQELNNVEIGEQVQVNRNVIEHFVPNLAELKSEMIEIAKGDGVDIISQMVSTNPYMLPPDTAIMLAKRAALNIEVKKLKAENEALKGKTETVLSNIEKAAKGKPVISSKTSKTASEPTMISEEHIADISDADLQALIKERTKSEGG